MFLILLLTLDIWAQSTTSECEVQVNLSHRFRREHLQRFRDHGFRVNRVNTEDVSVDGVIVRGRLESLIVKRMIRGERVEIGRVNAGFFNGLPSQMIARTIPIIQRACAQSLVSQERELCPMNLPHIKEERIFVRSANECDLIRFSVSVSDECKSQGFSFCMTEIREYEEDLTHTTSFRGNNCRVQVRGTNYFSIEETRLQRCEVLQRCNLEISGNEQLNTELRQESLQRQLEFNECQSPQESALQINQSERQADPDKAPAPLASPDLPSAREL